jgi:polyisoprenoid-binding protein YceI
MSLIPRLWLVLLLAMPAAPAVAGNEVFRLDPVHTRVAFRVDHAGLSRAVGTFAGATGVLEFDPADWRTARLEVRLPLSSLDLGDADWTRKVLAPAFLDGGDHPEAHFVSTAVEPVGPDQARVTGQLSLRGRSHPLVLDVRLNALKRHPLTFRRTAGFSATARLDRRSFGIDTWPNVIGHEVELLIEAEAIHDRGAAAPAAPETDDADPQ